MEHRVAQRELLRHFPQERLRRVVVAHREAGPIRNRGEAVHTTVVDLHLLVVEGVDHVAGFVAQRHVANHIEWLVRQIGREARVDRFDMGVEGPRQGLVGFAVRTDLDRFVPGIGQPVRAGKGAEHAVEAAIFFENHHDVADFRQRIGRLRACGHGCQQGGKKGGKKGGGFRHGGLRTTPRTIGPSALQSTTGV